MCHGVALLRATWESAMQQTNFAPFLAPRPGRPGAGRKPSAKRGIGRRGVSKGLGEGGAGSAFVGGSTEAPPGGVRLDAYVCQTQEQTEWCWAAVASAISQCFGGTLSQTDVAVAVVGPFCRTQPKSDSCNSEQELDVALGKTGNLARASRGTCLPSDVEQEVIQSQHPLCCRIQWSGVNAGKAHFVAIAGYDSATQEVCVADPRDGSYHWLQMSDLANAYDGDGRWDATYWTMP
jgi:Papain-like cysteine protease AvrRpt2